MHNSPDRVQKFTHNISTLEKPTLDNVEALLVLDIIIMLLIFNFKKANREKIYGIEQKYAQKKGNDIQKSLPNENYEEPNQEEKIDAPFKVSYQKVEDTMKSFKKKEEPLVYTRLDPPSRVNTYTNKFVIDEKKNKKVKLNKPENHKSYKQKFEEYLINKE